MKRKTTDTRGRSTRRAVAFVLAAGLLGALAVGTVMAYNSLRDIWLEQCVIRDLDRQVHVTSGHLVKADAVREAFGLRKGANLALIDFAAKREEALKKYPTIRTIAVSRQLPDGVTVTVSEREPFARMNFRNGRGETGRVSDIEGVVFPCRRGTGLLPVIREASAPGTQSGEQLTGRSLAALAVLRIGSDPDFSNLGILEVDASRPDYLTVTINPGARGDYCRAKLAWEGMNLTTPASDAALKTTLRDLSRAVASGLQPSTRVWNATIPGTVSADANGIN